MSLRINRENGDVEKEINSVKSRKAIHVYKYKCTHIYYMYLLCTGLLVDADVQGIGGETSTECDNK